MESLKAEFKKECLANGFANLKPNYFARCVGDGVFQTIYAGFKQYVSTEAPSYNARQPKDYYISIGLYSMYACWPEPIFVPGRNCGGYVPSDLLGDTNKPFEGVEQEYKQMLGGGLSVLNSLDTQKRILELRNQVMLSARQSRIHSFDLVGPYLACGNVEDALLEIDHQYTHSVIGFFRANDYLLTTGDNREYLKELSALRERMSVAERLWVALISSKYDFVQSYLDAIFERNCTLASKNGIPFNSSFHKVERRLPEER